MVDNQLRGYDRIDLGGVAALRGNGVTQPRQIHKRRLAENVMTDHARRIPRKIQVAAAFDELRERIAQARRLAAAQQLFGQHARSVGQTIVSAGANGIDGGARIEVIQPRAGQCFAKILVHVACLPYWRWSIGGKGRSSGPT